MSYLSEIGIEDYGDALEMLSRTAMAMKGFSVLLDGALYQYGGELKPEGSGIAGLLDRQIEDLVELKTFLRDEFNRVLASKLNVANASMIAHITNLPVRKVEAVIQVAAGIDLSNERVRQPLDAGSARKEVVDHLSSRALVSEGWLEVAAAVADIPVDALSVAFDAVMYLDPGAVKSRPRAEYVAELKTKLSPEKTAAFLARIKQVSDEERETATANVKEMRDAFIRTKAAEGADTAAIAQALNLKKATVERVIGQLLAGAEPEDAETASDGGRKAVNE